MNPLTMEIFLKTSVALAQHTSGTRCWVTTAAADNISVHQFCCSLTAPLHHDDITHIFRLFFFLLEANILVDPIAKWRHASATQLPSD